MEDPDNISEDSNLEFYEIVEDEDVSKVEKTEIKKVLDKRNITSNTVLNTSSLEDRKKEKKISKPKVKIMAKNRDKFEENNYVFSNEKNEDWKIELRNRLLDSLDNKPELTIKKEKSL